MSRELPRFLTIRGHVSNHKPSLPCNCYSTVWVLSMALYLVSLRHLAKTVNSSLVWMYATTVSIYEMSKSRTFLLSSFHLTWRCWNSIPQHTERRLPSGFKSTWRPSRRPPKSIIKRCTSRTTWRPTSSPHPPSASQSPSSPSP